MKHHRWHKFWFWVLRNFAGPFLKLIMGYRCGRKQKLTAPTLILANHNTDVDPALVALGFRSYMYFVSSEHALRKENGSNLIRRLFSPIVINKTKSDAYAAKEILRRLKSGYNVCLFAEGNRSYNGLTGPIRLSTAKLVKISGADLVTFRLEGGYFTRPRWSKSKRKGKMKGSVVNHYSAEQLRAMTDEEIFSAIVRDTYEDAYKRQEEKPVCYRGKNLAEDIETALYMCPECKAIGTIHSKGNRFACDCGLSAGYTKNGYLEAPKGKALAFSTITDWCRWQSEQLREVVDNSGDQPIFRDEHQKLYTFRPAEGHDLVGEGPMTISRTEFHCAGMTFPLEQITRFAIVDQMTLMFALRDGTGYEVLSDVPRSALKYLEAFLIMRNLEWI